MGRDKIHQTSAEKQAAYRQRQTLKRNVTKLQQMVGEVTNPALRYHGGKFRLADWIISHFPEHVCYVEPFGGGASVLLTKQAAEREVYNDLAHDVVNFFRVLREREDELIRAILLTPYAREEFYNAYEPVCDDPLEQARRFYTRLWQSMSSSATSTGRNAGWRTQKSSGRANAIKSFNRTNHLYAVAARFKWVQIEHQEASKVIKRYDTPQTLYYVDPPYVHTTRNEDKRRAYHHEMTDDDHRELAQLLHEVKGMVILSGYPCLLYDELYGHWRVEKTTTMDMNANEKTEALWLSPNIPARQPMLF